MFAHLLEKIVIGHASIHRNLTLTPVLLRDGPLSSIDPLSLEEALAANKIRVTEITAQGHVPELRVKTSSHEAVLILDGEELVGAKQNRAVNVTVLVPPQADIVIPVSCIEAGRWDYSRPAFAAASRVLNQEIRYRKADAVTRNLKFGKARFADQREVWEGVNCTLRAIGAGSPTSALSAGFENRANAISGYLEAFPPEPGQIGVVYRINDTLAGLDLFGSERPFAQAFPKLVRGAALQALAGYRKEGFGDLDEAGFLKAVLTSTGDHFAAVGLGEEVRFDTPDVGGGALHLDGELVHLFAFPRQPELPLWRS
jgi:hypothetical protein